LHLFEMAHLVVSSPRRSNLPVLLRSPGATVFSVGIGRVREGSSVLNTAFVETQRELLG
jgi:hypothetical protein